MKRLLLTAIGCLLGCILHAQTPPGITVKGVVIDSAAKKPLDFVTVALQNAKTQQGVKSTLTKADGSFEVSAPKGSYKLVLAFVGYPNKVIAIDSTIAVVNLGNISYAAAAQQLNEVQVTGVKPLMKQEVDRISYDVQADPESKAVTALDMMRKVPMVSVDGQDAIKLRGSGSYKILINGKESALMARNPSDILKSMPAANIVKIEVITTPPAKYDAEGLAGIINIITVKNSDEGYNMAFNTAYNTAWGYRGNINATVKQGKFGFNGYVGANKRPEMSNPFFNSTYFNDPDPVASIVQNGRNYNSRQNAYANADLSFEADTLNLITASFNFYDGTNKNRNEQFTEARDGANALTQKYAAFNRGTGSFNGIDVGINYQLGFKRSKDQLLTVSYKYSLADEDIFNDVTSDHELNYTLADYRQYNKSGAREHTAQLDYVHPFKNVTIEAGGKLINRSNISNFNTDTLATSGQYITDADRVNNFNYNQDVYSLYNSYTLKLTKWTFKGGLRYERTVIDDGSTTAKSEIDQQYHNLVPSFSMQRNLKNASLTMGFAQRIERPGIQELNPFVNGVNTQYVTVGNPLLRPSVTNNFELSYGNFTKGSIVLSTNYSFANNTIQNVASIDPATGITTTTFANVGKNRGWGADANINYPITEKLNTNINAELLHVWLEGQFEGEFYKKKGFQGHVFTYTSYKFGKGYRVGMNVGFDSKYVLLQGTDNYYIGYGANVSKEVFGKKGNITLGTNNPFSQFIKLDYTYRTNTFRQSSINYGFYRNFFIAFNYKFGRLNSEIKKNQRGINNDDKSSGNKN